MANLASLTVRVDAKGVKQTAAELRQMSAEGGRAEKMASRLGKAIGAIAIIDVMRRAVGVTMEFSQSIADLSAITGATGKDLKFYSEQAKEIGRTTSLSASQAATAFKLIASAKPDLLKSAEALNKVTRSAVTLAEATGMALPEAAKSLGGALNQFQLDASKADDVINILAASSKLGTAAVESVTEALKNAGPAANALDIDLAETVAGIQALAKSGREGADAGTGLRQVLLQLESSADKKLMPSVVGLVGALDELKERNLNNTELMELFGKEAFTAAAALLAESDTVKELNESLRGTDTAMEQATTRMDTLTGDLLALGSAITGFSIESFGGDVEGAIRKIVQSVTKGVNALTESMDTVITVVKVLSALLAARMAGAIAGYITNMNWATAATLRTSTAMGTMTAAAGLARGAMALLGGPVGVIALALVGLLSYTNSTDDAEKATERFSKKIKELKVDIKDLSLVQVQGRIAELKLEMEALSKVEVPASPFANATGGDNSFLGAKSKAARLAIQIELNTAYQEEIELTSKLNIEVKKLAASTKVLTKEELLAQAALAKLAAEAAEKAKKDKELKEANEKLTLSMREQRIAIAEEMELVKLSGLAWATRNAQLEVGHLALNNLDDDIRLVAEALVEEKIALYKATEGQRKLAEAAAQSAQDRTDANNKLVAAKEEADARMIASNEQLFSEMSDTYLNLIENGSDAFDNIGDSFKSMINSMLANLLALATQQFVVNIVGNVGGVSGLGDLISGGGFGGGFGDIFDGIGSLFGGGGDGFLGSLSSIFDGSGFLSNLSSIFTGDGFLGSLGSLFGFGGASAAAGAGAVLGPGLAGAAGAIHTGGAAAGAAGLFGGITLGGLATAGIGLLLAPVIGDILGGLFGGSAPKEQFEIDYFRPSAEGAADDFDGKRQSAAVTSDFGTMWITGRRTNIKGMVDAFQGIDDALASILDDESIALAKDKLALLNDVKTGRHSGNDPELQLQVIKDRYSTILSALDEGLAGILQQEGTQSNIGALTIALADMGQQFKDGTGLFAEDLATGINEFLNFEDIINELPEPDSESSNVLNDWINDWLKGAIPGFSPTQPQNPADPAFTPDLATMFPGFSPTQANIQEFDAVTTVWEQIIDKFKDLAKEGEGIAETYARISAQVVIFNHALDATGASLESTVFELIDISDAVIEAAGGLEAFTLSADSFYKSFTSAGQKFEDTIEGIKEQFEDADFKIPDTRDGFADLVAGVDLTTEAGQEAFAALLLLSDSADLFYSLMEERAAFFNQNFISSGELFLDSITELSQELASAGVLTETRQQWLDLLNSLDLTTEAGQDAHDAMMNLAGSADAFFDLMESMAQATDGITGLSESIRDSLLSEEDLYDKRKAEAEALSDLIATMTDPAEIAAALAEIESLNNLLFGSLTPEQQDALGGDIADYLDEVADIAADRLAELAEQAANDLNLTNEASDNMVGASDDIVAGASEIASAATVFQSGVDKFDSVVDKLSSAVASIAAAASNLNAAPEVGFGD